MGERGGVWPTVLLLSAGTHRQVLHIIRLLCFGIKRSSENLLNVFIKSKEGGGRGGAARRTVGVEGESEGFSLDNFYLGT